MMDARTAAQRLGFPPEACARFAAMDAARTKETAHVEEPVRAAESAHLVESARMVDPSHLAEQVYVDESAHMGKSARMVDPSRLAEPVQAAEAMREVGPALQLPADAAGLLEYCGVAERDRVEILAARPDAGRDPEWWALISALVGSLEREMEAPLPSTGHTAWPVVPESSTAVGMWAWAWALLANVPPLLEVHRRRGVPEAVSRATVGALGGVMGSHREIYGRSGVGLMPLWGPPLRFRGADYEIGRHSFTRTQLGLGDGVAGHLLMVHVPPTGPLDPAVSEQSIAAAARLFPQWYPDEPLYGFVCPSWLLDPQLAEYLPADSNILTFQRRFTILPLLPPSTPYEGDHELMRLALQLDPPEGALTAEDLDRIPQDTTLQRAFVRHLRDGRHFHLRIGLRQLA
ncbi:acyltransferase domain-containing protein [Kribbella sp. NPDC058245]|uniref:acyltransferase domain-containing protein n=1 Tax=Kribbella sp. NPDC058245 TaxID=3346399 RepID=UPI0036EC8968